LPVIDRPVTETRPEHAGVAPPPRINWRHHSTGCTRPRGRPTRAARPPAPGRLRRLAMASSSVATKLSWHRVAVSSAVPPCNQGRRNKHAIVLEGVKSDLDGNPVLARLEVTVRELTELAAEQN